MSTVAIYTILKFQYVNCIWGQLIIIICTSVQTKNHCA